MKDSDILEKQRNNFKKFMTEHKLNAYSWAKKAGVAEATIRHYLSGRNKSITAINLEKLARSIDVDSDILLNGTSKPNFNIVQIQKELFIHTFEDVSNFLKEIKFNPTPSEYANILLAWYELAHIHKDADINSKEFSLLKNSIQKIAVNS